MSDEGNISYGLLSSPRLPDQSVGSSISTSMQVIIFNFLIKIRRHECSF